MSKKIPQQYEIGQEMPIEDQSVEVDLKRYKFKSKIEREIPEGLTDVELEIWKLKNKKK
tara:strand:+ start:579 stop:755 length:177 start_codon:yes stop_codon:yes gene_type:complete